MADTRKVEIGFDGGQVLPLQMESKALDELRGALADGGWQQVETSDTTIDVSVEKIVFIRTAGENHKIGF